MKSDDTYGVRAERYWATDKAAPIRPRRSPDEQAQAAWEQVLDVLQMLDSMVQDGARIRLSAMIASPTVDVRREMVRALAAKVGRILVNARIGDE